MRGLFAFALAGCVAFSSTAWAEEAARQEAQVHFMSGRAYFDGARYAEALREFEEAVRLWPQPQLYYNLGVCKEKLGRLDEARADFERYLAEVPDAPDRETVTSRIALIKLATTPKPAPVEPKVEAPVTPRTDLVASPPPPKRKVWPWIVAGSAVVVVVAVAVILGLTVGGGGDSLHTLHDVTLVR